MAEQKLEPKIEKPAEKPDPLKLLILKLLHKLLERSLESANNAAFPAQPPGIVDGLNNKAGKIRDAVELVKKLDKADVAEVDSLLSELLD